MPEGPSLKIWYLQLKPFVGLRVVAVEGNSRTVNRPKLKQSILSKVCVIGKQLFLRFTPVVSSNGADEPESPFWLRYHFLLYGSLFANRMKDYISPKVRQKHSQNLGWFFVLNQR